MHREGLVVEFSSAGGATWVGNFQRGLTPFDHMVHEPGTKHVIVIAGGEAYVVNPETHLCERTFGGQIEHVFRLDPEALVFSNGLWLEALGESGLKWRTRRIFWDSFRSLEVEAGRITGEAWNPVDDEWTPFAVLLATGEVKGGSYPPELPQP
jgi:hypothetical protein